jgi:hypothetical protein
MQEIYQEPVGENGYYLSDPETLTVKNKGGPRGPKTPQTLLDSIASDAILKNFN